jgi:hypothetical protein
VDAILSRDGRRRVLEIKSMSAKTFNKFTLGDPKFEDAYSQIQYYLYALHMENGYILAINRDTLLFREFSVQYDDLYVASLLLRVRRLKAAFDNKTLPAPERGLCYFCGYMNTEHCTDQSEGDWL